MLLRSLLLLLALAVLSSCSSDLLEPQPNEQAKQVQSPTYKIGRFEVVASGGTSTVSTVSGRIKTWVATYTNGSRTVTMLGDARNFTENNITVSHATWVRVLNQPFSGTVDTSWINARLLENKNVGGVKDVLAHAMDYLDAGSLNANYGMDDTTEGADFNDYLGIDHNYSPHWSETNQQLYNNWLDTNETAELGAVDCSGYMRLVWGYRMGIPMCFNVNPNDAFSRIPRRAYQIWDNAPGTKVMTNYVWNAGDASTKLSKLRIGDLVFFNADTSSAEELNRVDHVGMYIGRDGANNMRFIHSRKSDNVGPTFTKDLNGKSILNNDGTNQYFYYVRSLVGGKRL